MLSLKHLHKESITEALEKAKHYRLLNEPWQAESICKDVLDIDPENQTAIIYLILSITDQFSAHKISSRSDAKKLCDQLKDKYQQKYYRGIIEERLGTAALKRDSPRSRYIAYESYRKAMDLFEEAEKIHPEKNEDVVLRWNACVRRIKEFKLEASPDEDRILFLDV